MGRFVVAICVVALWVLGGGRIANAQDVPGIEICTAEKAMERKNQVRDKVVHEQGPAAAAEPGRTPGQALQRMFSPGNNATASTAPQTPPPTLAPGLTKD